MKVVQKGEKMRTKLNREGTNMRNRWTGYRPIATFAAALWLGALLFGCEKEQPAPATNPPGPQSTTVTPAGGRKKNDFVFKIGGIS
jgi:hypothetical protein